MWNVSMLFLSSLGTQGSSAYLFNQLPADMIYPFVFGLTYSVFLAFILKKLRRIDGYLFYFCFLSPLASLFDYCENFGIILMLNSWHHNPGILISVTNVFSILKSSFSTIHFIVFIIALIAFGVKKLFQKMQ